MSTKDTIPSLLPDKPFPLGDATTIVREKKAENWLSLIEKLDNDQFHRRVNLSWQPTATIGYRAGYMTHKAAVRLCEKWDENRGNQSRLALGGYKAAMAFNQETLYLGGFNLDLDTQLNRMHDPGEQFHYDARHFGQAAWRSMYQYPNIYDKYNRLLEHSRIRYRLSTDEDREYLMAGMALPFMLTLAARLTENTPDFSCWSSADKTLGVTPFRKFFSTAVALAPDVVLPDNYLDS